MHFLITGGTGFIGSALSKKLSTNGHDVTILSRKSLSTNSGSIQNINDTRKPYDIIINLAGENLSHRRWNDSVKKEIIRSRIETTQSIINYIQQAEVKPKGLLSGSAIGFYGHSFVETFNETSAPTDQSFTASLCKDWESIANQAKNHGVRVCTLRTGIVLGKNGGALKEMMTPFKLGLGAQLGDGKQWMSWIHMADWINALLFLVDHPEISGPVNLTAPNPVTNTEFTKTLAQALHRPSFLKMPTSIAKLLFGEMADALLLQGQKVIPQKLMNNGYEFQYKTLTEAFNNIIKS